MNDTDKSPEAVKRREIVDDLNRIGSEEGDVLMIAAAKEITTLTAKLEQVKAEQSYTYIGKDGKPRLARDMEDEIERLKAERDALKAQPLAVTVKPLEWDRGAVDWARPLPGMQYVACSAEGQSWSWWLEGAECETPKTCENERGAKAAAQADYERRVLSVITARPDHEVCKESLEEAAQTCESLMTGVTHFGPEPYQTRAAAIRAMIKGNQAND